MLTFRKELIKLYEQKKIIDIGHLRDKTNMPSKDEEIITRYYKGQLPPGYEVKGIKKNTITNSALQSSQGEIKRGRKQGNKPIIITEKKNLLYLVVQRLQ
jgi:hypothetical protein